MTQDNRTDQEKRKRKQTLTRAVPPIRLSDPTIGKREALDRLASAFMALTHQYVTLFCTQEDRPDGDAEPIIATDLSERWQRVAIQQAAGICWLVVASARERPSAAHPRQARSLSQKRAQRKQGRS